MLPVSEVLGVPGVPTASLSGPDDSPRAFITLCELVFYRNKKYPHTVAGLFIRGFAWQGSLRGCTLLVILFLLLIQILQDQMVQVIQEASLAQTRGHGGPAADVGAAGVQDFGELVLFAAFGVCAGGPWHMGLSSIVAVCSRAGVGVPAAAIRVPVPAWGEDPSGIHREAASVAGRLGPHLCRAPEIMPTLWAVEFSQAPHLISRHRLIALSAFATSGHLLPLGNPAPPHMVTGRAGELSVHSRDEVVLGPLEHS